MNSVIIKPVAEGQMHFQTEDGTFTLPFDVICQAADKIRSMYNESPHQSHFHCAAGRINSPRPTVVSPGNERI